MEATREFSGAGPRLISERPQRGRRDSTDLQSPATRLRTESPFHRSHLNRFAHSILNDLPSPNNDGFEEKISVRLIRTPASLGSSV